MPTAKSRNTSPNRMKRNASPSKMPSTSSSLVFDERPHWNEHFTVRSERVAPDAGHFDPRMKKDDLLYEERKLQIVENKGSKRDSPTRPAMIGGRIGELETFDKFAGHEHKKDTRLVRAFNCPPSPTLFFGEDTDNGLMMRT